MTSAPVTIDWFRLAWDLVQRGRSFSDIADTAGIPVSSLKDYLRGSQPPHWRGERLIDLWCLVCAKPRSDLPMTEIIITNRVTRAPGPVPQESAISQLERAWRA